MNAFAEGVLFAVPDEYLEKLGSQRKEGHTKRKVNRQKKRRAAISRLFYLYVMMLTRYLWLIPILLLNNIAIGQHVDANKYTLLYDIDALRTGIFPSNYKITKVTEKEVDSAEKILIRCIKEYNITAEKQYKKVREKYEKAELKNFIIILTRYERQYLGATAPNGDKILWINFYCSIAFNNNLHEKEIITVHDGGNCFFNLKINLTKKKYFHLMVNGEE